MRIALSLLFLTACTTPVPEAGPAIDVQGDLPADLAEATYEDFAASGAQFGVVVDPVTGEVATLQNLDRTTNSGDFTQIADATCPGCGAGCGGGNSRTIDVELQRNAGNGPVGIEYAGVANFTPVSELCNGGACPASVDATGGPAPLTVRIVGSVTTCSAFRVYFDTDDTVPAPTILAYYDFDGTLVDQVGNAPTLAFAGTAALSGAGGGFTGAPGDRSLDLGTINNGAAASTSAGSHFDAAFVNQEMAVSWWQFQTQAGQTSSFWISSPTAGGGNRGFQAHVPWSDNTIYFDQSGCCSVPQQRITVAASSVMLNQWQHVVVQRDSTGFREIWVDGVLRTSGGGAEALEAFDGIMAIGSTTNPPGSISFSGRIDEFVVFASALSPTQIALLNAGASPLDL
ncbi:MAG: LamG domain-containing protein [Alphaproteobacteria bacterium]|nr:LamG domain-containing protein [Alphaproteobacteria bacterium]